MNLDRWRCRIDPANVRAAWWAWRTSRVLVRDLRETGLEAKAPPPPDLPDRARHGAAAVLHRTGATCLVRAKVLQAWDAAHGEPRDLVIGVTAPRTGFQAHAWLESDPPCHSVGFTEFVRRPA